MNVLLIEDDLEVGEFIANELRVQGHECVHFLDGEQAMESATENAYDVFIIDRMLPLLAAELPPLRMVNFRDE